MNSFERPFTFDRVVRILITIAVIVGLFMFVNAVRGVLLPFLIGWLLAYLMNPVVDLFQNKLKIKHRGIAIFLTLLSLIVVLTGLVMLVIPPIYAEIQNFGKLLSDYQSTWGTIPFIPESWTDFLYANIDFDTFVQNITREDVSLIINKLLPGLHRIFSSSLNLLIGIVASSIVVLYLIFILMDFNKISYGFLNLIPVRFREPVADVIFDVKVAMNRYFRGQAVVAFSVGILFAVGFRIINLPLGILLGLFMGLLNMVPYLQIVGVIPTAMLCGLKAAQTGSGFWEIFFLALLVMVIVQIIQDGFIVPKVMGKVTGLNPAIILLSLSVWGALLGIVGMIIALPMTTLLLSYYKRYVLEEESVFKAAAPTPKNKN